MTISAYVKDAQKMSELEEYQENKAQFMDQMKALRPDLFFPEAWSDDQRTTVSEMVRPNKVRTTLFASIPLLCRAEDCRFAEVCPLLAQNLAPKGFPCPIEMALVQQFMSEYMDELGVDPRNLVEVSMVRDMVDQEIQHQRTTWLLSMEDFIQENAVGVSERGEIVMRKELHLAVEMQDRLHKRKKDLRNQLLATREARAKVGQGNLDNAQAVSKALEAVRELERAKHRSMRKKMGYEDYDDYIDAEIVSEEVDAPKR